MDKRRHPDRMGLACLRAAYERPVDAPRFACVPHMRGLRAAVSAPGRWGCPHSALIPRAALCADDKKSIWTWRQRVLGESRSRCSCMQSFEFFGARQVRKKLVPNFLFVWHVDGLRLRL